MSNILEENLIEGYQRPVNTVGKDLLAQALILLHMAKETGDNTINVTHIYPYELPEIPAGKRIDVMFVLRPDGA